MSQGWGDQTPGDQEEARPVSGCTRPHLSVAEGPTEGAVKEGVVEAIGLGCVGLWGG